LEKSIQCNSEGKRMSNAQNSKSIGSYKKWNNAIQCLATRN